MVAEQPAQPLLVPPCAFVQLSKSVKEPPNHDKKDLEQTNTRIDQSLILLQVNYLGFGFVIWFGKLRVSHNKIDLVNFNIEQEVVSLNHKIKRVESRNRVLF